MINLLRSKTVRPLLKQAGHKSLLLCSITGFVWWKVMEQEKTEMGKTTSKQTKLDSVKKMYATRNSVNEEVKQNREKYLSMSLEEKRKLYKKKFVVIDDIQTWQQQAPDIIPKYARTRLEPLYDMDEVLNNKVCMWRGDITTLEIDAIVNAANNSLLGGGGVDGAIHNAAGFRLREECATINPCETGDAKITAGYNLPAKYVIHTVGPIGVNPGKLASCYKRCLEIAKHEKLKTVAFPCISTGIYGYDIEKATPVVLKTVRNWLTANHEHIERILFCVFLSKDVEVYEQNLLQHFPIVKDGEKPGRTHKKAKKEKKAEKIESKTEEHKTVSEKDNKTDKTTDDTDSDKKTVKKEELKCPKESPNVKSTEKDETVENDTKVAKEVKENKHVTRSKVTEKKQTTLDGYLTKDTKKKDKKAEENDETSENKRDSSEECFDCEPQEMTTKL